MNITTFGLDIAKHVMQVHWVDGQTGEVRRRALKRVTIDNLQHRLRNLFYFNQTASAIPGSIHSA